MLPSKQAGYPSGSSIIDLGSKFLIIFHPNGWLTKSPQSFL